MIKLTLTHSQVGSITVTPDAEGTDDFEQTLKRSEKTDGVVYEYVLDLQFTKKAKQFLSVIFRTQGGIEAVCIVNAYEYSPNDFKFLQIGDGTIKFTNKELTAERLKTSIEQIGVQRKVLNLMDTDVDLDTILSQAGIDLPATPVVTMTLHSKKIIETSTVGPTDGLEFQKEDLAHMNIPNDLSGGHVFRERLVYGQVDNTKATLQEFDFFQQPYGYDDTFADNLGIADTAGATSDYQAYLETHLTPRFPFKVIEQGQQGSGVFNLRWNLKHAIDALQTGGDVDICGAGTLGKTEITYWFEHRSADDVLYETPQSMGVYDLPGCGDTPREGTFQKVEYTKPLTLAVGDKLYAYFVARIYGSYEQPSVIDGNLDHVFRITAIVNDEEEPVDEGTESTYMSLTADTVFPESQVTTPLIYEALEKMFQYYSDQRDCFRSTLYGRPDTVPAYAAFGPESKRAIVGGANIRGLIDRKTFVNGNEFYQALNAMDNIGMAFESLPNGTPIVRIERLPYFYNADDLILNLGPVSGLTNTVLTKQYMQQIEIGYPKVDIEKTNGLDEANTLRRWKLPITQIDTKYIATSKYKTAGAEIENQRRLRISTEDSKNDDSKFFIDLTYLGAPGSYRPTKDDDFTLVQNLYDPGSAYNLNLLPRRRVNNHLQTLAAALYLSPSLVLDFTYGEGNYNVITQKTGEPAPLAENGPIDLTGIAPIIEPEGWKFSCPLSASQMAIIRSKPYGYFKFQEYRGGPDLEGFLFKVTRSAKKKLGTFELIKVYRPS